MKHIILSFKMKGDVISDHFLMLWFIQKKTSHFIINDNIIWLLAFLDVFSTKNGYQKKHKNLRLPDPPTLYLGLSPNFYHFFHPFPLIYERKCRDLTAFSTISQQGTNLSKSLTQDIWKTLEKYQTWWSLSNWEGCAVQCAALPECKYWTWVFAPAGVVNHHLSVVGSTF